MILINPTIIRKSKQGQVTNNYSCKPIIQTKPDSFEITSKNVSFCGINANSILKAAMEGKDPDNVNLFKNSDTFYKFLNEISGALTDLEDKFIYAIKNKDKLAVKESINFIEKFGNYWTKIDDYKKNPNFEILWNQDLKNNLPENSLAHSHSGRLTTLFIAANIYKRYTVKKIDHFIDISQEPVQGMIKERNIRHLNKSLKKKTK